MKCEISPDTPDATELIAEPNGNAPTIAFTGPDTTFQTFLTPSLNFYQPVLLTGNAEGDNEPSEAIIGLPNYLYSSRILWRLPSVYKPILAAP